MKRAIPLILILFACGASRDAILSRTMAGLDASAKVFEARDAEQQQAIIATATSLEDGQKQLATYRVRRDKVAAAFVAAYSAVGAASIELNRESLGQALAAARDAYVAMKGLLR